jgi:hypothetical protein
VNDGGTTIGTIQTNTVDLQTSAITGTITYKDVMDNMLSKTQSYINCVNKILIQLKDDLLWGGLITYTKDRIYSTGYFDYLGGNTSNEVNIFGKPQGYQERIDNIFNSAKDDVDNDTSPILGGINEQGFSNSEVRKIKRKLTKMIDERKTPFIESVEKGTTDLIKNELSFIGVSDQVNFILSNVDGYKNKQGGAVIYDISGTTGVDPQTTNAADTYVELQNDVLQIRTGLNQLDTNLKSYQIITNGEKEYNNNLTFKILDNTSSQENAFFIIFGKEILLENGYKTFVDSLLSEVSDSQLLNNWASFLYTNIGFNVGGDNQPATRINDGRYIKYENSKKTLDDNFSSFKNNYFDIALPNEQYLPFKKGKERLFDYTKQNTVTPPNDTNLFNLWSTVDSIDDKFNLKKKMN